MLFYHNNRRKVKIKQEMMRETMEKETSCAESVEDSTACGHRSRIKKFLRSELGNSLSGHEATVAGLHCNMGSARQDVIEVECPPRGWPHTRLPLQDALAPDSCLSSLRVVSNSPRLSLCTVPLLASLATSLRFNLKLRM